MTDTPDLPKYAYGMEGDPEGAVLENWTEADFVTWFDENVRREDSPPMGNEAQQKLFIWLRETVLKPRDPGDLDPLQQLFLRGTLRDGELFAQLPPEIRNDFYQDWNRRGDKADTTLETEAAESDDGRWTVNSFGQGESNKKWYETLKAKGWIAGGIGALLAAWLIWSFSGGDGETAGDQTPPVEEEVAVEDGSSGSDTETSDGDDATDTSTDSVDEEADDPPEPTVTTLEEVVRGPGAPQTLGYEFASHHYTVTVGGDGEALAALESTSWYTLLFITTTAEGEFEVNCTWGQGRDVQCRVFEGIGQLIAEAEVTAEWTSPDTVIVSADNVRNDSPAELVVLELDVRAPSSDVGPGSSFGTLTWEP